MISVMVRLSIASAIRDAGEDRVSVRIPARPGRRSSSASSTPIVTSRVLAPGNFRRPAGARHGHRPRVADERLVIDL